MKPISFSNKILTSLLVVLFLSSVTYTAIAQDQQDEVQTIAIKSRGLQRVGNTFESIWLIDNQTVYVPLKNTLEFDILHRFGTVNNGYSDFFGMYAPSNIRLGLGYTPINNLMLGFGFSKDRLIWDVNLKYAILKEHGDKTAPISLTYFGNMAADTRGKENFVNKTDRYSYFHQLMIAKKVSRDLSIQGSLSLSHFNSVEGYFDTEGQIQGKMKNDHLAFSILGRYKISDAFAFIGNYDQPITKHKTNNPNPNLSIGVEIATPLHAFQVFVGNYRWMVPQYNNVFNQNDFSDGSFLVGFNITRLIDLQEEDMADMMFKRKNKSE
ncbi:MAG: hypothetical protein IPN29_08905 [Saprospiraceae bacterium]|nr:hypothetical protein [Saprospiraceae bacterium]